MSAMYLQYDDTNMHRARAGRHAATPSEWKQMLPRLRNAKRAVQELSRSETQGFATLPYEREALKRSEQLATTLQRSFTDLVVLGIGGSDLGTRAIHHALRRRGKKGMRLHFAGSSTDPDELYDLLAELDLKRTCVNVISKSGGTLEPMSAFLVLRKAICDAVGKAKMPAHIIATTDAHEGTLRKISEQEGYRTLPIPGNVGGRFSVLSPVGLLPAAAAGYRVRDILSGARMTLERFHDSTPGHSEILSYAGLHVLGMEKRSQNIHVLMPYTRRLEPFAHWVRQLIAESLGKKKDRKGRVVHTGPTPVVSIGPEDQHSQLQLYSEGPYDKLVTFVEVRRFEQNVQTPRSDLSGNALASLGGRRFSDIIHTERYATAESLRRGNRPNGTIFIDRIHERALGELFLFFELSVAVMGELLDVNAYDQPGVEDSKSIMNERLRSGKQV